MNQITYDEFLKVDIRVGTVLKAEQFPEAKKPAYKLTIDFGNEIGIKKSSAQIKDHHPNPELLVGMQVLAVTNFPAKQIGPYQSQVLVLGIADEAGKIILVSPRTSTPNGQRLL